ncbi:hypothetical protein ACQ858_13300 [Variovorax ureilyticus]|uniref:hypothetical protein n=1 Tax=Variovorax ureilyticus TaxID=1836198 RepID=UPI003D66D2AA
MIRFVGDVARGADCGCRCVVCGARLVARQGDVRMWSFAHEASQERPECFAGAVNLLRRIAIERLQQRAFPALPPFRATVTVRPPLPQLQETVTWHAGEGRVEQWGQSFPQQAPVALLRLSSGTAVRLFIEVDSASSTCLSGVAPHEGMLLINVPLPPSGESLKDLSAAIQHIDNAATLQWIRLPDANAKIAEVSEQLKVRAKRLQDERQQMAARPIQPWDMPSHSPGPKPEPVAELDESPWAAWRKPRSGFVYYGFQDGSAWVLFDHKDSRHVMAPWPKLEDGWDEAMPARVGVPDLQLGVYVLKDQTQAMIYLGGMRPKVRTASTWVELLAIRPSGR